jgi:hypothetical protein
MEMSQGNFLCSYLKQTKMSFFFLFYKIREQKGRTDPILGIGTNRRWEDVGKEHRRVNIVQILGTHGCKWKSETC